MNINAMMQQAKKMQAEMDEKKAELEKKEFIIEKQGITITIMGSRKIKSIKINEFLIDPEDPETLEDLIVIGVDAANQTIDEELEKLTPSTNNGMPF